MTQNALNNTASIFDVDNLRLDGNTIISTDTNGDVVIAPNGTGDIVTGTITTDNVISMLRSAEGQWFGMNDQTDVFGVFNSTGTPEGGITANIGSICTDTTNGAIYVKQTDSANTGWTIVGGGTGQIVQITQSTSTASTASTTAMPFDDTLPQITEGASYMTHTHTPLDAANKLKIEFSSYTQSAGSRVVSVALFDQADTDASICMACSGAGQIATGVVSLFVEVVADGTDAITYEVRFGCNDTSSGGMNGNTTGGSKFSTAGIATLRVTEYLP